jgi:hypothetical protein
MTLLEVIDGIVDLVCSWRLYLCLGIGVGVAALFHASFPDRVWVWFVSVPLVVTSFIVGWRWQEAADYSKRI